MLALALGAVRFFLDRPVPLLAYGAAAFGAAFVAVTIVYVVVRSRLAPSEPALSSEQESLS